MKIIYILIGSISLALGFIGVVLPILPTTPFLLLASFCFVKGSKRIDAWFKTTKLYKEHLERFQEEKTLTKAAKRNILVFATVMLLACFFMMHNIYGRIAVVTIICIKWYVFVFKIKTAK